MEQCGLAKVVAKGEVTCLVLPDQSWLGDVAEILHCTFAGCLCMRARLLGLEQLFLYRQICFNGSWCHCPPVQIGSLDLDQQLWLLHTMLPSLSRWSAQTNPHTWQSEHVHESIPPSESHNLTLQCASPDSLARIPVHKQSDLSGCKICRRGSTCLALAATSRSCSLVLSISDSPWMLLTFSFKCATTCACQRCHLPATFKKDKQVPCQKQGYESKRDRLAPDTCNELSAPLFHHPVTLLWQQKSRKIQRWGG